MGVSNCAKRGASVCTRVVEITQDYFESPRALNCTENVQVLYGFIENPLRLDCNRDSQILTAVHKDSVEIAAVLEIGVVVVAASAGVGARKRAAATNGASR